jgi:hypothetical protein
MPRPANPDYITKLEQRAERINRQLRKARAAESDKARAEDTRRKIIEGALCETHALANRRSEFAGIYVGLLKQYVRLEDRWLFADIFHALLPAAEAEKLLADGEIARAAADKAKAEKRAAKKAPRHAVPEAAE